MFRKILFTFFNLIGVTHLLRRQKNQTITVLSLHRIAWERDYFWNPLSPSTFEKLLQYITKYYTVISFSDIPFLEKTPSSKPYLILSFDDGYYDFYEHAMPLLKKYKVHCNHNIVNECATNNKIIWTQRLNIVFNYCKKNNKHLSLIIHDKKISIESFKGNWMRFYLKVYKSLLKMPKANRLEIIAEQEIKFEIIPEGRMMDWDQINECSENLVEIGSHTYTHDSLSTITNENILKYEVINSINEIENRIGKKVNIVALPNGEYNSGIKKILSASQIKYVLFVDNAINKLADFERDTIKNIYRVNIVEESYAEMVLRIELFHTKIRKYA